MAGKDGYKKVKILIASPSDVEEERDLAEQIIYRLKIKCENNLQLVLQPKRWELDVPAKMGKPAQDLINEELVDDCDCAVCVFWKRIGTATEVAEGGAVEELERMLKAKKPVLLYFSDVKVALSEVDREQWNALEDWKKKLWEDRRGLPKTYKDHNDFEKQLKNDLEILLEKFCDGTESTVLESQLSYPELEKNYKQTLIAELGKIRLIGAPDIDSVQVNLDDTFVPLRISHNWKTEDRFKKGKHDAAQQEEMHHHSPDELMRRVFPEYRMLLVIGDPGSGKTTLMKYYALCCLQNKQERLFGSQKPVRVFYLPLRDLKTSESGDCFSLPEQLSLWAGQRSNSIEKEVFETWLRDKETKSLVLFDGLDEISDLEKRKEACNWIDRTWSGFPDVYFVVTSRFTGYRKVEGVELSADHIRADVMDFTSEQQEEFLSKWFTAAYLRELCPAGMNPDKWLTRQNNDSKERTRNIVEYLNKEKNKGLRELAAIPMMLQVMAILWKERDFLPGNRLKLYSAALDYLLEYRDERRKIPPLLPADKARRVLAPVSLWMQQDLKVDEVERRVIHEKMQETLDTFDHPPTAKDFCGNLVDRAGLLAEYGDRDYVFRHKTFREYLAGFQLVEKTKRTAGHIDSLVTHFGEDWWNEPLRFFMSQADAEMFDHFMSQLFDSEISEELSSKQQTLLQTMIEEAPQKKTEALCQKLLDPSTSANRQWYILDCLKYIGKPHAYPDIKKFEVEDLAKNTKISEKTEEVINAIIETTYIKAHISASSKVEGECRGVDFSDSQKIINRFEHDAQYILIRRGSYIYSVSKKNVTVPDLYVAKYPVTNKQYRSFIDFLAGKPSENDSKLSLASYQDALNALANSRETVVKGFDDYLKEEQCLANRFRSEYEDNRKFNKDDQPVVGLSWYAARAYCFWLSLLESGGRETDLYRLPTEKEWEWAAGGRRDKPNEVLKVRKYPWGDEPEPTAKHANYDENEGTTTPVGRYPDGVTPEGLYDMAGNVWEWMENRYDNDEDWKSLRGGSWYDAPGSLACSYRDDDGPGVRLNDFGFRVVRPSPAAKG